MKNHEFQRNAKNKIITSTENFIHSGAAATKWLTADKIKDLGLKLIKPGEKYSFSGTLSLVKTALVLSKDGSMKGSRDVWTGPTDGSNIEYKVSQDFDMAPIQQ